MVLHGPFIVKLLRWSGLPGALIFYDILDIAFKDVATEWWIILDRLQLYGGEKDS